MHRISKLSLVTSALAILLVPALAGKAGFEGAHPIILPLAQQSVQPGQTVCCEVDLDKTTDTDLDVTIGASNSSIYSSLPSTVTVPAGEDHVTFYITLTNQAYGYVSLSASANGQTIYSEPTPILIGAAAPK